MGKTAAPGSRAHACFEVAQIPIPEENSQHVSVRTNNRDVTLVSALTSCVTAACQGREMSHKNTKIETALQRESRSLEDHVLLDVPEKTKMVGIII